MIEDWKAAIAARDGRNAELEAQVAEAAKSAEMAEELRDGSQNSSRMASLTKSTSSCSSLACAASRWPVRCSATTMETWVRSIKRTVVLR